MEVDYKKTEAEIFNHKTWVEETNPELLKSIYENYLKKSEFTIISFSEHYFKEQGYTCFWLLAESHLAIHTFPENNKTYIELSSCSASKLNKFKELISDV